MRSRFAEPASIAESGLDSYCSLWRSDPYRDTTMEPINDPGIMHSVTILFTTLIVLILQLAALGFHWLLWIVWAAWCLWAVNWKKTRHVLAIGGWAPATLLLLLIAIIWSRLATTPLPGFSWLPNFWWQTDLCQYARRHRHVLRLAARRLSLDAAPHQSRPAGARPRARSRAWASLIVPCELVATNPPSCVSL